MSHITKYALFQKKSFPHKTWKPGAAKEYKILCLQKTTANYWNKSPLQANMRLQALELLQGTEKAGEVGYMGLTEVGQVGGKLCKCTWAFVCIHI